MAIRDAIDTIDWAWEAAWVIIRTDQKGPNDTFKAVVVTSREGETVVAGSDAADDAAIDADGGGW